MNTLVNRFTRVLRALPRTTEPGRAQPDRTGQPEGHGRADEDEAASGLTMWRRVLKRSVWSLVPASIILGALHLMFPLAHPLLAFGFTVVSTLLIAAWMEWVVTNRTCPYCGARRWIGWVLGGVDFESLRPGQFFRCCRRCGEEQWRSFWAKPRRRMTHDEYDNEWSYDDRKRLRAQYDQG